MLASCVDSSSGTACQQLLPRNGGSPGGRPAALTPQRRTAHPGQCGCGLSVQGAGAAVNVVVTPVCSKHMSM
jgi:hypothetical protein